MYLNLKTHNPGRIAAAGLLAVGAIVFWAVHAQVGAVGGDDASTQETNVRAVEERMYDLRAEQAVLARRGEILRAQLDALADVSSDEFRATRDELLALILDRKKAESEIAASFRQLWDAQGTAERASRAPSQDGRTPLFDWPVEPILGISAHFDDPGYRARFGFAHQAIDIPVNQGSTVRAAAEGVVEKISDQGLGFNSIVIRHRGGYATLYGHVSTFLVAEGDRVRMGDAIAESGGMPGTAGAGRLTTGPHLHLELLHDGTHVDPLMMLPANQDE